MFLSWTFRPALVLCVPAGSDSGGIDNSGCSFALTIRASKSRSWDSYVRMRQLTAVLESRCLSRVDQWRLLMLQGYVFIHFAWVSVMHTLKFCHDYASVMCTRQSKQPPLSSICPPPLCPRSSRCAPDAFRLPSPPVCINLRKSFSPAFAKLQKSNTICHL